MNSIAILICWYGKYPWYFSYFVYSCSYNPSIDFIIITDNETNIPEQPDNLKIIHKTLDDLKKCAFKKFGFKVNMDYPYKLCDFKPAYGLLFDEYVRNYNFWALSDLDIIYGDLRNFFTEELLNDIDFISVRHDYCTGCFSLFRNNKTMNTLFKKSKDYKKAFTSHDYLGFDELNFKHCEISDADKTLEEIETEIECFTHVVKNAEKKQLIKTQFDFILLEGVPGKIKFDKGKLIYNNRYEAA